jgi:hypothetical protein
MDYRTIVYPAMAVLMSIAVAVGFEANRTATAKIKTACVKTNLSAVGNLGFQATIYNCGENHEILN